MMYRMKKMEQENKKMAYDSPKSEIVLIALEQCIAISDMYNNDIYEEDFVFPIF